MSTRACAADESAPLVLHSPNGRLQLTFQLSQLGQAEFAVAYADTPVVEGTLGLDFVGAEPLGDNLKIVETRRSATRHTYEIAVGKASSAQDLHNELVIQLTESRPPQRQLSLEFRAFDDGVAFRYGLPRQGTLEQFVIRDERTRLSFLGDPLAKALPLASYNTPYEWYYETKPVSQLTPDRLQSRNDTRYLSNSLTKIGIYL